MTETAPPSVGQLKPWLDPTAKPFIKIDRVSKKFGDFTAVNDVSLNIYQGEFFALLGGSGCGKTTLLRMIAGFETPTAGTIQIDGRDMSAVPPYARPVNMMFQSYALFPHMSVEANVEFGLKMDGVAKDERRSRAAAALELVKMGRFATRKPHQLSGGQRQRVALARALVKRPKVLLLDEPLAALDKKLREETQFELINIQEKVGITFVVVTHDQGEAMTMATRIAVMDSGQIVQTGTPTEVYEYPGSRFVAEFIGTVNIFDGQVLEDKPDSVLIHSAEAGTRLLVSHAASVPEGVLVGVAVRPEKIVIDKAPPADFNPELPVNVIQGRVTDIAYLGGYSTYLVEQISGKRVRVSMPNRVRRSELPITWGDPVFLSWAPSAGVVLTQ